MDPSITAVMGEQGDASLPNKASYKCGVELDVRGKALAVKKHQQQERKLSLLLLSRDVHGAGAGARWEA